MNNYDAVFQWDMTSAETGVYKLAAMYEEEFLKIFKDHMQLRRVNTLPKRGDPRKSNLFRYCWKLRRETRGLLEPVQYRLYIRANLTILFMNYSKNDTVRVEPNSLCGDKAWIRWKVYERWYKNKEATINATIAPPDFSSANPKIIKEIDRTKKFLYEKCEGKPTKEKMKKFLDNGFLKFWIMSGKVTKYYFVWSPFVSSICNVKEFADSCSFDATLFTEKTSKIVKEYLEHEYKHELHV